MHDLHCQSIVVKTDSCWLPSSSLDETVSTVKKELESESMLASISPSDIPATSISLCRPRRNSTETRTCVKRARPYPAVKGSPQKHDNIMSNTSGSGTWSHSATRSGRPHTSAHGNPPPADAGYALNQQYMPDVYATRLTDVRPGSSSSSSLTGAIGEPVGVGSSQSRHSHSPPSRAGTHYPTNEWAAPPHPQQVPLGLPQHAAYPGVAGMGNLAFEAHDLSTNLSYDYSLTNRNPSPDSPSSGSSTFGANAIMFTGDQYPIQRSHSVLNQRHTGASYPVASHATQTLTPSDYERLKTEVIQLRRRVHELEADRASRAAIELASRDASPMTGHPGLPTPPPSASFLASWKTRTEIRKRMFCSLNRAGNALCAWHDSRRERREYPPRNAPPGYLNCGCTHEEALFEESLARHNVGSYYPGENVRMDPALRNPLLKLLQQRYGYLDGDFERDPVTGNWVDGEGAAYWEQQAHSGSTSRRRLDTY
ncbi:hypothetical protein H0H81_012258 [Sphagnurus paluster]|uniref:Uncharacterized protein n=1 Tax=Sphagnurus paluster TaxID=117069 RepID=A0A9P7GPE1_9AGAR|nr:hypothetical protein H0H81_012258 [Sphagnurus paluster]